MLNKCQFIGNLGGDVELRYTQSGSAVANFSIALNEKWKDKEGNKQEKTEWIRIVAFNKLAEIMGEYLRKGSQVYIEGKIQTRKWQDKEGVDRYTTEIVASQMVMLDTRGEQSKPAAPPVAEPSPDNHGGKTAADFDEDDLPF